MSFATMEKPWRRPESAPTRWDTVWEWIARPMHYRAVRAFRMAAERGDGATVASLVDPGVSVVVDSGDRQAPTIRVVSGVHDAVALLLHGMVARPGLVIAERSVNNQAGLMISRDDEPVASMAVDFAGRLISVIWIRLQPQQQRHWNSV